MQLYKTLWPLGDADNGPERDCEHMFPALVILDSPHGASCRRLCAPCQPCHLTKGATRLRTSF